MIKIKLINNAKLHSNINLLFVILFSRSYQVKCKNARWALKFSTLLKFEPWTTDLRNLRSTLLSSVLKIFHTAPGFSPFLNLSKASSPPKCLTSSSIEKPLRRFLGEVLPLALPDCSGDFWLVEAVDTCRRMLTASDMSICRLVEDTLGSPGDPENIYTSLLYWLTKRYLGNV